MTALRGNVEYAKQIFGARLGNDYVYGGTWDENDPSVGCDCSGLVTDVLSAVTEGAQMIWGREGLSTESYRYKPLGPQRVGPFNLVHVASWRDFPADAAVLINLHHEGAGGPASHMNCCVDGVYMESNGSVGCCTLGGGAMAMDNPYWNDWFYLPGPIEGDIPIVPLGLDYAGGRPGGAAIKAAGYDFVVRYLSNGGPGLPGKLLTPAEANDLRANGVDIVSNWETTADRALAGRAAGIADAEAALAQVLACGGRGDRPIYFSVDFDAAEVQQVAINNYLLGAGTILPTFVGVYGGYWVVKRALDAGAASWGWQTVAWSGSNIEARRNLFQRAGFVTVDGVQCDVNEAHTADYGQWGYQVEDWDSVMAEIMGTN